MGSLWLLWLWVPLGLAEEETLLDTRLETSDLHWTVHPPGEGQWEELSALDAELGGAVRTFEVCSGRGRGRDPAPPAGRSHAQNSRSPAQNSRSPAQNSWLRSRWVPRGAATTVMAELRFTVMACDSLGGTRGTRGTRGARETRDTAGDSDSLGGTRGTRDSDRGTLGTLGTLGTQGTRDSDRDSLPRTQGTPGDTPGDTPGPAPRHRPDNINLHGKDPKLLNLHGNDPEDPKIHRNYPKHLDLHGDDLEDPNLHGNNFDDADLHGNDPEDPNFHRNDPKTPSLYGHDPKHLDLQGNNSKPLNLHGNHPKPLEPHDPPARRRRPRSPLPAPPRPCKETFTVFYHESDADTATATHPPWMENPYVKVDTVAAEHLARPGGGQRGRVNRKVLRLGPLSRAGFYLAFQDLGACMALLSVRLFFRRCPAVTARLARFPATVPAELVAPVSGQCVAGAVPAAQGVPLMYCREDGRWAEPPALGCVCGAGMEPDEETGCRPCPPETFKVGPGGGRCQPCPAQSEAPEPGATSCRCQPGFLRAPGEGPPERCSAPPSAPRALEAKVNGSGVRLSWSPPRAGGDRPDLRYNVGCRACPPPGGAPPPCGPCGPLAWAPPPQGLRTPVVSVAGLRPRVTYSFRVTARSGVSPPPGAPESPPGAEINVTAGADVPPPVLGVVRVGAGPGGVTLAWPSPAPGPPGTPVLDYEVKYYEKLGGGEGAPQFLRVPRPRAELGGLRRGGLYGVRVRARSEGGYGDFGPETTLSAPGAEGSRGGPGGVVAGAAALGGLLVLALLGGALAWLRRGRLRAEKRRRGPAPRGLGGTLYIDPLTYEDPEVALRDFAQEIDVTCVTIEEVIGAGEFGEVWRGRLALPGQPEAEVAVKTLKGGAGERQRREFLREAARMGQFRHPNVLRLRGVVSAGPPAMIVTEFLLHGALDAFLRGREGTLSPLQLVAMLRGIAAGMRYLSEAGFVHRDLAARNILVDAHLVCKVSDFGLSRALDGDRDSDPTYTSSLGGKIPIRWTAPEAIAFRTFTSASDAWSYGIVMWEVLSFGERPYWDMSNQDVINAIEQDYRLPPPPRCPPALHHLMLQCWQRPRHARPTFPHIVHALDHLIRRPESLRPPPGDPPSSPPPCPEQQCDPPGSTPHTGPAPSGPSVGAWPPGPGGYQEPFGSTGVTGLELLPRLSREDLLRMGVTLGGHQQRIIEGTQSSPKGDPQC